jgi:hypothetical protein
MITTTNDQATCTACLVILGPTARPIRLLDLVFHEVCAPECRSCAKRLGALGESLWRYTALPIAGLEGYRAEPAEYWCDDCWELSDRAESYAQD